MRSRLIFPLVVAAGLLVLLINELTYAQITRTLSSGIALTDARIASARCLQLLTDAETAQRGYLLTGREAYLLPYERARKELPAVLEPTLQYLASGGPANEAASREVRTLIGNRLGDLSLTIDLAQSGRRPAAMELVASDLGVAGMATLRAAFSAALARAAEQQTQARISIYSGLLLNRIAVAALTVLGVVALWLVLRRRAAAPG